MALEVAHLSDDQFRALVRGWLHEHVVGEFAELRGREIGRAHV